MSKLNQDIREAIDGLYEDRAKELLREALKEADGETYYLASRVALDDDQRKVFLQKALDLDPFHALAYKELKALTPRPPAPLPAAPVIPAAPSPMVAQPPPTPPAAPPRTVIVQSAPEPAPQYISAQDSVKLRMAFNRLGYQHPNTKSAKDYYAAFTTVGAKPMNNDVEAIILHFGIGKALTNGIYARRVTFHSKGKGYPSWEMKTGELILTNRRFVGLKLPGALGGSAEGHDAPMDGWTRFEPQERRDPLTGGPLAKITLFGGAGQLEMDMSFVNQTAALMQGLSLMSAVTRTTSHSSTTWLDYAKKKSTENNIAAGVAALTANSQNIQQAFYQLMFLICQ